MVIPSLTYFSYIFHRQLRGELKQTKAAADIAEQKYENLRNDTNNQIHVDNDEVHTTNVWCLFLPYGLRADSDKLKKGACSIS